VITASHPSLQKAFSCEQSAAGSAAIQPPSLRAKRGNPAPLSNNASHKISLPIAGGGLGWGCYGLAKTTPRHCERSAAIQRPYPTMPLTKPLDRYVPAGLAKTTPRHCEEQRDAAIQRPSPTMPLTKSPSPSQGEGWGGGVLLPRDNTGPSLRAQRGNPAHSSLRGATQRGNPAPFSTMPLTKSPSPSQGGGLGWGCSTASRRQLSVFARNSATKQSSPPVIASAARQSSALLNSASHKISLPLAGGGQGWGCSTASRQHRPVIASAARQSSALLNNASHKISLPFARGRVGVGVFYCLATTPARHCERSAAIQRPSQQCLSQNLPPPRRGRAGVGVLYCLAAIKSRRSDQAQRSDNMTTKQSNSKWLEERVVKYSEQCKNTVKA